MTPIVSVSQVRKSFGAFEAVRGVSFTIRPGECFGLLGPNGAGKSTLINMIYGAVHRTSGELRVFDLDPDLDARTIKSRLGVVTQDNALDDALTVRENMELYAAFVNLPADRRQERVRSLLNFMNLAHKEDEPIRALSGGMKRRLVFVRALLGNPDLVILDEPTTGLDPAVRHLLWGKVNQLKAEGKTVLLTTHYMHEAEVLCDRVVIVNKGEIIAEGTPQELRARFAPGYVGAFEKNPAIAAAAGDFTVLEDSSGVYVRAPELADLLKFQERVGSAALQLRPSNLEDVFLALTGQELTADA